MTKILHITAPLLAILLLLLFFLYTNTTLDLKSRINSFFLSGPCSSNSSINWVVTSGKLNLVQRTALESIFLHNKDACLNIYVKEDMEHFDNILHHVNRLLRDGFLIFILKYNFRELLSQTVPGLTALPTEIVTQFLQQLSTYEKGDTTSANVKRHKNIFCLQGEYWAYSHESNFVRLLVLLQHGGVYLDTDIVIVKPLEVRSLSACLQREIIFFSGEHVPEQYCL